MSTAATFDVLIIGGGAAGLSAALALGRARRRVLLAADGPTRNAPAHAAHNIFTRDGTPPSELVRIGIEQLAPYDVAIRRERVTDAQSSAGGFIAAFAGGHNVHVRGIVLATGMRDVLPPIPGFTELWGRGVFHCPYCHGWEVAGRPLGIHADGERALHLSRLIRGWTDDLVLFTNGPSQLSEEDVERIRRNGIVIRQERVERLAGSDSLDAVILEGGERVERAGIFVAQQLEPHSDLAERLGCDLMEDGRVRADELGRTSVPFVFVAGDAGPNMQSVAVAAASGTKAGAGLNHDFLDSEFTQRAEPVAR